MNKIIFWIRNNKLKFFIIDSTLLLVNLFLRNFSQNDKQIAFDFLELFFGICLFFGLSIIFFSFWSKVTKKYPYFFIQIKLPEKFRKRMFNFGMELSLILNFIFFILIWVNKVFFEQFIVLYYAIPWFIIICAIGYDSKNQQKIIKNNNF